MGCGASIDYAKWMAEIDDTRPINYMTIPGTHDTMANRDSVMSLAMGSIGKCHHTERTLPVQLDLGCRCFDIRLVHTGDGNLQCWHGKYDMDITKHTDKLKKIGKSERDLTKVKVGKKEFDINKIKLAGLAGVDLKHNFVDVCNFIKDFLDKNPSETGILKVKEESKKLDVQPPDPFDKLVAAVIEQTGLPLWKPSSEDTFKNYEWPTLGEIRGKVLMWQAFKQVAVPQMGYTYKKEKVKDKMKKKKSKFSGLKKKITMLGGKKEDEADDENKDNAAEGDAADGTEAKVAQELEQAEMKKDDENAETADKTEEAAADAADAADAGAGDELGGAPDEMGDKAVSADDPAERGDENEQLTGKNADTLGTEAPGGVAATASVTDNEEYDVEADEEDEEDDSDLSEEDLGVEEVADPEKYRFDFENDWTAVLRQIKYVKAKSHLKKAREQDGTWWYVTYTSGTMNVFLTGAMMLCACIPIANNPRDFANYMGPRMKKVLRGYTAGDKKGEKGLGIIFFDFGIKKYSGMGGRAYNMYHQVVDVNFQKKRKDRCCGPCCPYLYLWPAFPLYWCCSCWCCGCIC